MQDQLRLTTLLSQVLIAFTIEADNEFERQLAQAPDRLFMVSLVMGENFMRFVPDEGIRVSELSAAAGLAKALHPSLPGMERWGYVVLSPDQDDARPRPPRQDWLVRPTPGGRQAKAVWQALPGLIEARWRERFGSDLIVSLRDALQVFLPAESLPHYLPVLMSKGFFSPVYACPPADAGHMLNLPALLSQVLLGFTLDFERGAELSLPLCVNLLRVIDAQGTAQGTPERELPLLAGISKQAISMSLTYMSQQGFVEIVAAQGKERPKSVRLTRKGQAAQAGYRERLGDTERQWRERFGTDAMSRLYAVLTQLSTHERFSEGLMPPDGGWRGKKPFLTQTQAILADPRKLPHYPMVLHRGGYPDGS